jgi:hypothetical protein
MKKIFFISIILVIGIGCIRAYSQIIPTYPIPSFDIKVNGYANFREEDHSLGSDQTEARREVDVQVKSGSGSYGGQVTVWVYTLDRTTVLGPFTVYCDDLFTTAIDYREWGVLVESEEDIIVDVWIIDDGVKKVQRMLQNNKPANKHENTR